MLDVDEWKWQLLKVKFDSFFTFTPLKLAMSTRNCITPLKLAMSTRNWQCLQETVLHH
jgi:hypothetical protein